MILRPDYIRLISKYMDVPLVKILGGVRRSGKSTRETDNLMEIKDHYHKYVVCRDPLALGNDNGIEIVHIADFLLKENW